MGLSAIIVRSRTNHGRYDPRYDDDMKDGPSIVSIAALIGDHARAEMLTALVAGQALTATELAQVASITKQTASVHLAKLLDAKLVAVESQGRHRYFRLADADVARLLENLMGVAQRAGAVRLLPGPREPELRKSRVCYDHLAGELGVLAFEGLRKRRLVASTEGALRLTPAGRTFCGEFGVEARSSSRASAVPFAARAWTGASAATTSRAPSAKRCSIASTRWAGPSACPARASCGSTRRVNAPSASASDNWGQTRNALTGLTPIITRPCSASPEPSAGRPCRRRRPGTRACSPRGR